MFWGMKSSLIALISPIKARIAKKIISKIMKNSFAILALIGEISAIKLDFIPQNIVQTGSIDEKSINWDANV
jgi:hypothetical protein